MAMVVAAALAWERGPGIGLVVDMSDLEYSGGDRLFLWKYKVANVGLKGPAYKVALVQSPKNHDRIQSLLEEEEDQHLMKASFDTLDDAINYVISETSAP